MLNVEQLHEVPAEAIAAWKQALKFWGQWHKFFLQGFKIAADVVYGDWRALTRAKDRKAVFGKVAAAAQKIFVEQGSMKPGTFERYCKIARYSCIYCVPWEIAQEANRDQLRWCKEKAKVFTKGTQEERMERAWEQLPPELGKGKRTDGEDDGGSQLLTWPDPGNFETVDEFLMAATKLFVDRLQKDHGGDLQGQSDIKVCLRRFIGDVAPLLKAKKKATEEPSRIKAFRQAAR